MEIDDAWAENYFVVRANLIHQRVGRPDAYVHRGRTVYSFVTVWNDRPEYNLYGVTDCIEVTKDGLCIVEYKPTRPKDGEYREEDAMQVFAQKLCVDYVFGGDCRAELYYADTKQRIPLPFQSLAPAFTTRLRAILAQMRAYLQAGQIPPIPKGQPCGGCSLRDICMPKARCRKNFRERVTLSVQGETEYTVPGPVSLLP